ncbi:MAG: hypothetical protein GC181_08825 [Bacteroidetes bacterium]|nr:hypothetical protein [Bacteroidota bacterium]
MAALVAAFSGCNDGHKDDFSIDGQDVGVSAKNILVSGDVNELVLEFIYVEEHAPQQETIDSFVSWVDDLCVKPKGIRVVKTPINSLNEESFSIGEVQVVEDRFRTEKSIGDKLAITIFFADAGYSGDETDTTRTQVLGIAYHNTSIVIFEKSIEEFSDQPLIEPKRSKLERTVLYHEFGHLLGLVNAGTSMVTEHQDVENGHHCNNEQCLMYWSIETNNFVDQLFSRNTVPEFDKNCLDDLAQKRL